MVSMIPPLVRITRVALAKPTIMAPLAKVAMPDVRCLAKSLSGILVTMVERTAMMRKTADNSVMYQPSSITPYVKVTIAMPRRTSTIMCFFSIFLILLKSSLSSRAISISYVDDNLGSFLILPAYL